MTNQFSSPAATGAAARARQVELLIQLSDRFGNVGLALCLVGMSLSILTVYLIPDEAHRAVTTCNLLMAGVLILGFSGLALSSRLLTKAEQL